MTDLVLHYHPLSSYCHKVLIALDELGIEVEKRLYNPGDPAERAAFMALWPTGKMPLLVDHGRPVAESSIIIEHLQHHHASPGRTLIPANADEALEVRLWDRLFDMYLMTPMQACTAHLLRPEAETKAAYRFFDQANEDQRDLGWEAILQPHLASTAVRMRAHSVVLCLQDTTELDFNGQDIGGLGPLSYEAQRGMYLLRPML